MKRINMLLLLCCLCAWHIARAGTCTTITPQLSTLSVGTINVQRDAPVGTVIFPARRAVPAPTLAGVPIRLCWVLACDTTMPR